MIKQLLATVAVAAMAFGASAESKVLWTAEDAEGYAPDWGTAVMLSAEDVANVTTGDIISMTVEAVADGWHQLLIQAPRPDDDGGWLAIGGQGGLSVGNVVNVPVIPAVADYIHKYGVAIQGDGGVTIKEITANSGSIELGPDAIWFGPAVSTWTMYAIRPFAFENVKVGDKIVVDYDPASVQSTVQFLFGGWGNLVLATYDNLPFITVDEEKSQITVELVEELSNYESEEKTYDAFELLKANGLSFQGANIIFNQISLVPNDPTAVKAIESANEAVYYTLQGVKVTNPAKGQIYIVKKGAKAVKVAF